GYVQQKAPRKPRGGWGAEVEADGNHDGCETSSFAASLAVTATDTVALNRHNGWVTRKAGIF
ncbi:MAG: hypothetical protein QOC83_3941, partial [Pseudonocardiales bacterium]|nr:hypothetical protein [Pseudonocardiales bacterium]